MNPIIPVTILTSILENILKKPSVDVPAAKAAEVAKQITDEVQKDAAKVNPEVAIVPVKSGWKSKINWFNGFVLTGVLGYFGLNVPTTPEEWLTLGAGLIVPVGNFVLKQWFTKSVTPSSLKA